MTYFKYHKCYLGCIIRSVMLNKLGNYAALLSSTSVRFRVLFSVPVTLQKSAEKKQNNWSTFPKQQFNQICKKLSSGWVLKTVKYAYLINIK